MNTPARGQDSGFPGASRMIQHSVKNSDEGGDPCDAF